MFGAKIAGEIRFTQLQTADKHLTFGSFQMNRILIKTIIDIHFQAKITSFSIAAIEYYYCLDVWRKGLPAHFFSLPTK